MSLRLLASWGSILVLLSAYVYRSNPLIFGVSSFQGDEKYAVYDHLVYDHYQHLDDEIFSVASLLGKDLGAYRNHCLRVLTFTKYFLPESIEEDIPDAMDMIATAIPYLPIGLWVGSKFSHLNYVESSRDELEAAIGGNFAASEMEILRAIILQQHKITDYRGLDSDNTNALVNAVRKANWVDLTMGLIRFDLPASLLETAYEELESGGFHTIFWGMHTKLSPNLVIGILEAGSIMKW